MVSYHIYAGQSLEEAVVLVADGSLLVHFAATEQSEGDDVATIETERLVLRPWDEKDAEALYRWAKDPEVGPRAGWDPHRSVEESAQVIREVLAVPESYAIVQKASEKNEPVGAVGLKFGMASDLARGTQEAELGYWLARPLWGEGLIPEAAGALLEHAFLDLRLDAVWAGHYEGNAQSRRVMEKLGLAPQFTRGTDGRLEHVMRVTRAEWTDRQR